MPVHATGNHLEDIFYHLSADDEVAFTDAIIGLEGSTDMGLALTREVIADHARDQRRAKRRRALRRMLPALFAFSAAIVPSEVIR